MCVFARVRIFKSSHWQEAGATGEVSSYKLGRCFCRFLGCFFGGGFKNSTSSAALVAAHHRIKERRMENNHVFFHSLVISFLIGSTAGAFTKNCFSNNRPLAEIHCFVS